MGLADLFLFWGVPKLVTDIGEDWADLKAPIGVFNKFCLVALSKSRLRSCSSRCRFISHLKSVFVNNESCKSFNKNFTAEFLFLHSHIFDVV